MVNKKKNNNNNNIIVRDYLNNTMYCLRNNVITIYKFSELSREVRTIINIYEVNSFVKKINEFLSKINGG